MNNHSKLFAAMLAALVAGWPVGHAKDEDSYYIGEKVHSFQPKPENHKEMGLEKGKLVFDLQSKSGNRQGTIRIPLITAHSASLPLP